MTEFPTLKKDYNRQQHTTFLLVAAFVALSGLTVIIDVTNAAADPVFAQEQDGTTNDNRAILWVDVKDFYLKA